MNSFYTYLIGWSLHNKWYYGRRTSSSASPDDLWVKYFTSSKIVHALKEELGDPDVIQVRKVFSDKIKCAEWEIKVIRRLKATTKEHWLNISDGQRGMGGKPVGSKEKQSTRIKKSISQRGKVTVVDIFNLQKIRVTVEEGRDLVSAGTHKYQRTGSVNSPRTKLQKEHQSNVMKGRAPWNKGKTGQPSTRKGVARPRCSCVICKREEDNANLFKYHTECQSSPLAID